MAMNLIDPQAILDDSARMELSSTLSFMLERMEDRNRRTSVLRDYLNGRPPMPWVHSKAASAYRKLIEQAQCNLPLLVVDTVANRLAVEGFRLDGAEADRRVWVDLWQRNSLDIFAPQVQREALATGTGYVSVWNRGDGRIAIRGESSDEVFHDPDVDEGPLSVARVVKVWGDLVGQQVHMLFVTPDLMFSMTAPWNPQADPRPDMFRSQWSLSSVHRNDHGKVPFVPFLNRPGLDGGSLSEISDLLPHFDKINTLTAQHLLAAELGAFRIRWATGIDIPTDKDGKPIEPFDVALNRLWVNSDAEGKFGSFEGTPLEPYLQSIDQAVQQVAAISRTPPFLLMGKITNLSAEAIRATDIGMVQKVMERQRSFGQSWQDVIRLGLLMLGDPMSEMAEMETMWRDPEIVSEGQRVDALVKLFSVGLPWQAVMERYGATPGEIARWDAMRSDDTFNRLLNQPAQSPGLMPPSQAPANAG
jgi:hypothetical protein